MKVRLAITGSFGNQDIGDEAMLTEDLAYVRGHLGVADEDILLFGHKPDYMAWYHRHPRDCCFDSYLLENNWTALQHGRDWRYALARRLRALRDRPPLPTLDTRLHGCLGACDAVLVTGGGTINTRDPVGRSLRRMHAMVSYFRSLGLPVFMSGQTIGPLGVYPEHDALACEIVSAVDVLTVRDSLYSRRYLDLLGHEPKTFLETFDDALALPYADADLNPEVSAWCEDGDVAAVNVTEYTSDTTQKRAFVAQLVELLLEGHVGRVVLLSHHAMDLDRLIAIRDSLANDCKPRVLIPDTRRWRDAQLKKLISMCRLAVGGRYHFIVFAGSAGTPFVGMAGNHYSYIKQDGFARQIGMEQFILTERETWDIGAIRSRIDAIRQDPPQLISPPQRPSASMESFGEWLAGLVAGRVA